MGVYKLKPNDTKIMHQFETMCGFQMKVEQIADVFGVSIDTLHNWVYATYKESFRCAYQRFANIGIASLNTASFQLAKKDSKMNIWLRKQWLKEKDPDKQAINEQADIEDWQPIADLLK